MSVKQQTLMRGTWILTLTSLFVKILSAVYRVPFQNLVGDEGFYVYQQVYPLYGIAMTFSLTGLPIFLSKLVAEETTIAGKRKAVTDLFPFLFWLSSLSFLVLFLGRGQLAKWMGDSQLAPLIGVVAFVFLLMPFLTSYRGFFQGLEQMEPTAYSQLVEQTFRVGVILIAGRLLAVFDWSIYQVGTWAMSGALIGGLAALGILLYWQKRGGITVLSTKMWLQSLKISRKNPYLRRLFVEGGLICGFSSLLVLFQLIDAFVVKNMLVAGGASHLTAKLTKGAYDRGQPLIQVGMVIGVAIMTAFLPTLRRYYIEAKQTLYQRTVTIFIRISLALGSAASVGLVMLLPSLNIALFSDSSQQLALQLLMVAVVVMTMILVFQIIYQSQNLARVPLISLVLGLAVKIILSPMLTKFWGTIGTSLATLLGLSACLAFLVIKSGLIQKITPVSLRFTWKLLSALGMMIVGLFVYHQIAGIWLRPSSSRIWHLLFCLGGVLLGGSIYLFSLMKLKIFTTREWLFIPLGKRLLRLKK